MVQESRFGAGPEGLRLRPMERRDAPELAELDRASNPAAWSAADFEREFALPHSRRWVAEIGERAAGFAVMWVVGDEAQILQWGVAPSLRRRGAGSALMRAMLDQAAKEGCRRVALEYRAGNEAAESLYRKFGFVCVGQRKKFYEAAAPGEAAADAVLMRKEL